MTDQIPIRVGGKTVYIKNPKSTMALDPDYKARDPFEGGGTIVKVGGKLYDYFKGNLFYKGEAGTERTTPGEWIDRDNPEYRESIYADKKAEIAMSEITNLWHGSPHKFSKFDLGKVGTGEGVQAFGWGGYLTESPKIAAEAYAKGLSKGRGASAEDMAIRVMEATRGNKDDAIKELQSRVNPEFAKHHSSPEDFVKKVEEAIQYIKKDTRPSYLYEATLHKGKDPSEYAYLDWDKPINRKFIDALYKQLKKEKIKDENIEYLKANPSVMDYAGFTGQDLYDTLSRSLDSQKAASAFLKRAGIDGIRYPSGTLSGGSGKYKNYVVFDDADITINKRFKQKYK